MSYELKDPANSLIELTPVQLKLLHNTLVDRTRVLINAVNEEENGLILPTRIADLEAMDAVKYIVQRAYYAG
jgi:hypothetical protein